MYDAPFSLSFQMQNHFDTDGRKRWIASFILFVSLCTPTSSQGVGVKLEVHPDSISIGESAELTWEVWACQPWYKNVTHKKQIYLRKQLFS